MASDVERREDHLGPAPRAVAGGYARRAGRGLDLPLPDHARGRAPLGSEVRGAPHRRPESLRGSVGRRGRPGVPLDPRRPDRASAGTRAGVKRPPALPAPPQAAPRVRRPLADHAQERHDRLESPALEARARHARISAGQRDRAVSLDGGGRAATGAGRRARDRPGGSGRAVRRSRQWIDGSRVPAHVARPRGTAPGGGADFSGARRARAVSARPDRSAKRRILLADADAFYVAVARLADPAGAGQARLLIVGGSPERRGVVTSASYEARAYGVHSAMPMARAVRLCPGATVVPVPWDACAAKSREIGAVLRRFTPAVEQASSDEFYLDLSGTEALYGDEALAATAHRIRQALTTETALSVSIGGGTSRLIAKLAASLAKPRPGSDADGVRVVEPGAEGAFMLQFALADIPFIGPKFQERLARFGLQTVSDAVRQERETLVRWLGEREGTWLYERIRGIDRAPVEPDRDVKSVSRDETFATDLDDDDALAARLLALADRASADVRAGGLVARTVTVKVRDADFTTRQASRTLAAAVRSDRVVYAVARELLARLRAARRVPARLLGVALSHLAVADSEAQLSLLEPPAEHIESERDRAISRAIDEVRERFGRDALGRGGQARPT
ncbi:MAG: hypothetical protein DMD61_08245 [Gemmatimonadetes bacterium]|nr:MAG: hypothetical protein DMD61_08245 [Gemmatimonadota bacterium]